MGGPGDGAQWHEGNTSGPWEQDGLAAEGSLFRNYVRMMTGKLTSVAAKHNDIVRELGSKQDCLVDKVLLLWNNAMELADKLARVAGRPGWQA